MNRKEARQLRQMIERSDCVVTGMREWPSGSCDLTVVDPNHTYGVPFIVASREDWEERVRASKLYEEAEWSK